MIFARGSAIPGWPSSPACCPTCASGTPSCLQRPLTGPLPPPASWERWRACCKLLPNGHRCSSLSMISNGRTQQPWTCSSILLATGRSTGRPPCCGWVFEPQPSILDATLPNGMLPSDVREMIQRRLARLSSPTRNLLAAGAILEHDFTFEELCQVAQLAPQKGLAALEEALQSLLLHESSHRREGRRGVSYHFADDKIREVVYAAAGDARRRLFRSRAYFAGARGRHRSAAYRALVRGSPD